MTDVNSLPTETFLEILTRTDGRTLGRCRGVCKKWKECIDDVDQLWQDVCEREFKCASKIAKKKSGNDCKWYHIYRNFIMWQKISTFEINVKPFYKFTLHDKCHALDIDYSILPLKDTRGFVLYDTNTLKYIPIVVPDRNCIKISNNDHVTAILLKSGLLLQRTVDNVEHMSEAFFKADKFVLQDDALYYCNGRDVYKVNLISKILSAKLIKHFDYDIKEMQYSDRVLHIFTECGKILSIGTNMNVIEKSINCPVAWIKQIKHIRAIDDRNFVCYSRNLFKIETDKYKHLYLDFPPITALFFYGDFVLIGTKAGEILLYRLSSQKRATKPIFENIAMLPVGEFAVQLDVCERVTGPVIVAATFFEILLIEVDFFPYEKENRAKKFFPASKLPMYKRLSRLKERLQLY